MAAVALNACGGLQSEDPGQVLRDAGAAMAKLTTVNAALKFTKGTVSFQGYVLTSATAAVRLGGAADIATGRSLP